MGWGWGDGGRGSSPPVCSPGFQPRSYCLLYLHLFESKTSAHTHTHTLCQPWKPLILSSETLGLPPRDPPSFRTCLSEAPEDQWGQKRQKRGERAPGTPLPATLGRLCNFSEPQFPQL